MSNPAEMTTSHPPDNGFDPLEFWIRYQKQILLYGGLLLVALAGAGIFEMIQQRTKAASEAAYASARTADDYRKVAADYPRTISGANAAFRLADRLREDGKLDEAAAAFRDFTASHPTYPLIAGAYGGLASVLEQQGKLDEALAAYQKVTTSYPNSFVAAAAWIGQARVLAAKGKTEEARRAYETVIGQFQDSQFASEAQRAVQLLKK
jgi:TolA-binding protein